MKADSRMGMLVFLAGEANFFLLLILAYVYYGSVAAGAAHVRPLTAGINTAFLVGSSVTMRRAEAGLARHGKAGLCRWLAVTIVLGAVFLIGQAREYATLIGHDVTVNSSLFGTTFFTLTGFHGLHVLAGLIALAVLLGLGLAGDFSGPRSVAVETVALYWHFVDVVWLVIFSVIYVSVLL
jgi:heme/copper-type cytochrome/quinol oxidase subunit 3